MPPPTCANHPDSPAAASCQSCLRSVCSICLVIDGSRALCVQCGRSARRTRLTLVSLAVVVACVGVAAVMIQQKKQAASVPAPAAPSPFAPGVYREAGNAIEERLAKEPCDRQQILALAELLAKVGAHRPLIDRAEAFWKKCGPLAQLRWHTYEAHKRLSELDRAIADATVLIEDKPNDKDFWWWRGIVYEEQGQLEKAAADFRQALTIQPRLPGLPFNLANIHEKLGQPCEAIFPLEQFLRYHPDVREKEGVERRLARLYAQPPCATLAGKGRAVIRFQPGDPAIRTAVTVGGLRGSFIIDTGTTYTAITSEIARKLALDLSSSLRVHTPGGIVKARLSVVDRVQVQGVQATHVPVAVLDELPAGVDGLLGLSFLARFDLLMESLAGRLTITARRR
jgi:clan AA aspartic protease (TIGR02281 family)